MRANVNVNCSHIICIHVVQEFLARIKHWVEFVIFRSRKTFLTWKELEDVQNLNKGCRFSQQLRIENWEQITRNKNPIINKEAILVDKSRRNRESRIETQQLESSLDSWFLTRFSVLDSQEDQELSVNLLLNSTAVDYCYPVNPMIFIPYYKGRDYDM